MNLPALPLPPIDALRQARDTAQTTYAHTRQRCISGHARQSDLDAARSAYMLAQDEYRAALARNGGAA